jgi:hypothetical protein
VTTQITEASIQAYIDESCVQSCLVFVDGIMSPSLSKTSAIPKEVIACSIASLNAAQFEDIEVNSMLDYIPDVKELPRNSYASDVITVLNSVRQDPHNTDIVSIDTYSESLLSSHYHEYSCQIQGMDLKLHTWTENLTYTFFTSLTQ